MHRPDARGSLRGSAALVAVLRHLQHHLEAASSVAVLLRGLHLLLMHCHHPDVDTVGSVAALQLLCRHRGQPLPQVLAQGIQADLRTRPAALEPLLDEVCGRIVPRNGPLLKATLRSLLQAGQLDAPAIGAALREAVAGSLELHAAAEYPSASSGLSAGFMETHLLGGPLQVS